MTTQNLQQVPHLDQWFGVWAMEPTRFSELYNLVMRTDVNAHLQAAAGMNFSRGALSVTSGVAVISVNGRMMKHFSSFGLATSTVALRQQLRQARVSPDVGAVLLHIESPGGTSAGTKELADEVRALAMEKPVTAYVDDLGASAAYWVASQAGRIYANAPALVGSIGTYGVVYDMSGAAAKEGIKVHVVRAGEFKGVGTPGTPVTDAHLAEVQRVIDGTNEFFLEAVARGRKMPLERVRQLADGRVHLAADAKKLGLIDGVATLDEVFQSLAAHAQRTARESAQAAAPPSDPIAEFSAAVKAQIAAGKSASDATRHVVVTHPDLHRRYLAAYNAAHNGRGRRR